MRIGEVIGKVTLSIPNPTIAKGRLLIVRPYDPQSLRQDRLGQGEVVVAYDEQGANIGQRVSFSEGREAAMPFHPTPVAVDAYIACLLDTVTYEDTK